MTDVSTVFLTEDLQNDMCHKDGVLSKNGLNIHKIESIIPNIIATINFCRQANIPTIATQLTVLDGSKEAPFSLGTFKNLHPIVNQVTEQVSAQLNRPKEPVGSASPQAHAKAGLIRGSILVKNLMEEVNSQTWQNSPNHNDNQNPGLSAGPKDGNRKRGNLMIQVGAFKERATAKGLVKKLQERGYNARLLEKISKKFGLLYRVRIHGYASMSEARMATSQLKKQGFGEVFIARPEKTKKARKNKQAIVAQSTQ